jgi:CBS domain-containing protein
MSLHVRDVMTPGVVTIVEDATIRDAGAAMAAHRVHAVLVVGRVHGTPLGWVTSRGILSHLEADGAKPAAEAITEEPRTIEPSASAREALVALQTPDTTRLLVTPRSAATAQGVVTDLDLVAAECGRHD